MNRGVIIQASSRRLGDTNKVVVALQKETNFDVIDLSDKNIMHFDYEFANKDDDFRPLFQKITKDYKTIVFLTPIYWYTMSGMLKVFLDRISDFLHEEKDTGRRLRQMKMAVVSCSNSDEVSDGFTMPFERSAEYLGIDYLGHLHTWVDNQTISEEVMLRIKQFASKNLLMNV